MKSKLDQSAGKRNDSCRKGPVAINSDCSDPRIAGTLNWDCSSSVLFKLQSGRWRAGFCPNSKYTFSLFMITKLSWAAGTHVHTHLLLLNPHLLLVHFFVAAGVCGNRVLSSSLSDALSEIYAGP